MKQLTVLMGMRQALGVRVNSETLFSFLFRTSREIGWGACRPHSEVVVFPGQSGPILWLIAVSPFTPGGGPRCQSALAASSLVSGSASLTVSGFQHVMLPSAPQEVLSTWAAR